MLYRKIRAYIEEYLRSDEDKILLFEGARQIGKSYIIRDMEFCELRIFASLENRFL